MRKEQWVRSYYPKIFDAGISTTSRVESWNAVIKHYLNSRSSLSDFIEFIEKVEKGCYFSESMDNKSSIFALLEFDSLLRELKKVLCPRIYENIIIQYSLIRRDYGMK